MPLEKLHIKNKSKQRDCFRAGVFGRNGKEVFGRLDLNTLSIYRVFVRYLAAIEEYSARELRYDIDSLDALIGVTRKFEQIRHPYLHIWGMPYPSFVGYTRPDSKRSIHYFANSLVWIHAEDRKESMAKLRRRANFPSWSWAGWAGKVSFPPNNGSADDKLWFNSVIKAVSFECESGEILDFYQMVHKPLLDTTRASFPRVLILKATVLSSSIFSYDDKMDRWYIFNRSAQLYLSQGPINSSVFFRELKEGGRWQCIFIGYWLRDTFVMILESHKGFMSRAGIFQIRAPFRDFEQYLRSESFKERTFRIE